MEIEHTVFDPSKGSNTNGNIDDFVAFSGDIPIKPKRKYHKTHPKSYTGKRAKTKYGSGMSKSIREKLFHYGENKKNKLN